MFGMSLDTEMIRTVRRCAVEDEMSYREMLRELASVTYSTAEVNLCRMWGWIGDRERDRLMDMKRERAAQLRYDHEVLVDTLVHHLRADIGGCHCGWSILGFSHPVHVADTYEAAMLARGDAGAQATAAADR